MELSVNDAAVATFSVAWRYADSFVSFVAWSKTMPATQIIEELRSMPQDREVVLKIAVDECFDPLLREKFRSTESTPQRNGAAAVLGSVGTLLARYRSHPVLRVQWRYADLPPW